MSIFILGAGCLAPGGLVAQDPPQGAPGDTLTLSFEREVFAYPEFERRNPFRTLASGTDTGPRFENLVLLGILYSPFEGESLALLGEGSRTVSSDGPGGRERVTVDLTGATFRAREGEIVGNVTIGTIEREQITIELDEFGLTETRIMLLPRATPGGGP